MDGNITALSYDNSQKSNIENLVDQQENQSVEKKMKKLQNVSMKGKEKMRKQLTIKWTAIAIIVMAFMLLICLFIYYFKEEKAETKDVISSEVDDIANVEECLETTANLLKYENELNNIGNYKMVGCGDGSFRIGIIFPNDREYTYFNYSPPITQRGTPVLFTRLYWSKEAEVSVRNGATHLSIAMRANQVEDYRFRLEVDVDDNAEDRKLQNCKLVLLNETDIQTNESMQKSIKESGPIPVGEMAKYHNTYVDNTWVPEAGMANKSELEKIRIAAYGGDAYAILRLYALGVKNNNVGADQNALQIAAVKLTNQKNILEKTSSNSLILPVITKENVQNFHAVDALWQAAEAVRTYREFEFLNSNQVEPNINGSRLESVPNYVDFFNDYGDYHETIWGAWELDFDGDGLTELIYFYGGGTFGNEEWQVIHLDKEGMISSVDSGGAMRSLRMYVLNGRYYFANWSYDYNDKQSQGVNLFSMSKDGVLRMGIVNRESIGMRTVLTDLYDKSIEPLYEKLASQLFLYYQKYKTYDGSNYEKFYTPDEQTAKLFEEQENGYFIYRLIDVDNDGIEEIVGEKMYFPSSAHQFYTYNIWALKKGKNNLDHLTTWFVGQEELLQAFPLSYENKNYFLTLQPFGDSQYLFKLQEIADDTSYLLAVWVATLEDQVNLSMDNR